ncbi:PREDICTED: interferon-induced very large GTPase 1-like [Cyprinodon variegatus]|uniref:interferon-induced very large GTPase 1-like n=1 Tax=Cyprinodon variegatus TaxID=28743 RepID=UPI0007426CDA|nr:PREDICTED: interferon-induced very large GTPase 1-like [Cyprinodon variegatus]
MEYNPDTGNCYIPGLWNGNPPMAPVNAGYSEAVYELKKNIIQQLGKCGSTSNNILEFREWISSLWNAVKHEKFSFRNSLVADPYMRLCTEYNKWEWEFKKEMYTWVTNAETRISNFGTAAATSNISDMENFITVLESEAVTELIKLESIILENLKKYFEQPEGHVYLVEGYREEFSNSTNSLRGQTERSVFKQLRVAADIKQGKQELDIIKTSYTEQIEKAVCALIDECRKKKVKMTDRELEDSFNRMWTKTLNTLTFAALQILNVYDRVYHQLSINLAPKGSHACELLSKKRLQDCGLKPFTYKPKGVQKNMKAAWEGLWSWKDIVKERQKNADCIISACSEFVLRKMEKKTNYHDTYIQEILHIIDEKLYNDDVNSDIEFEVSLKQHICGSAARKFKKMHEDFIQENDPKRCLIKESFSSEFSVCELEDRRLQSCIDHMNAAIEKAKAEKTDSVKTFVENICKELGNKLVIPQDALNAFMVLNKADQEQFAHWLSECVKEMKEALREKFKNTNFETKLRHLHLKPQGEIFNRVVGCGKQCPFCEIPCDAGGAAHSEHFASLHRPEGLGQHRWTGSGKLSTDICNSLVISNQYFRCSDTNNEWHPFKEYRKIYPDWKITLDSSYEASDYWKYVMNKYNKEFAEAYKAEPADIPDGWKKITVEQAMESLKKSFSFR